MLAEELSNLLFSVIIFGGGATIMGFILAPSQFLKVIHQETKKSYTSICLQYYKAKNLKVFFRGGAIYGVRQFVTEAAFGISQYIYGNMQHAFGINHLFWAIFWQCALATLFETSMTLFGEVKEIEQNKGELLQQPARITDIIYPVILRNYIAWLAPVLSAEITIRYMNGSVLFNIGFCFLTGLLAAIISLPFDLAATQNCGATTRINTFIRLRKIFFEEKNWCDLFSGFKMRTIQIIGYTILTSLLTCIFEQG